MGVAIAVGRKGRYAPGMIEIIQTWLSGAVAVAVVALIVVTLANLPGRLDQDDFDRREDSW